METPVFTARPYIDTKLVRGAVCLFTRQFSLVLNASTYGGDSQAELTLGSWLYIEMVYQDAVPTVTPVAA